MKTLTEKIKEQQTMLGCLENVVDEIRWRAKSIEEDIESTESEMATYRDEHDGEENAYLVERKEICKRKLDCYKAIEAHLEKLI